MRVARHEDVAIELPLQRAERLRVTPWHDLVAVAQAELELADFHHLGVGEAVCHIRKESTVVEIPPAHVHVCGKRAQVVVGEFVDNIARAEDVLDLARLQQRLELLGQIRLAMRDVQIADDQDEHHGRGEAEHSCGTAGVKLRLTFSKTNRALRNTVWSRLAVPQSLPYVPRHDARKASKQEVVGTALKRALTLERGRLDPE